VALFRLDEYNQAAREAVYIWIDHRTTEHAPSLLLEAAGMLTEALPVHTEV
jgi:hypothetical protein